MANESSKRLPVEMLCLSLLRERDMYCYEMVQEISARSGGQLVLAEAALYMSMYKLQDKQYISDRRETVGTLRPRTRVYYHLEPSAATCGISAPACPASTGRKRGFSRISAG